MSDINTLGAGSSCDGLGIGAGTVDVAQLSERIAVLEEALRDVIEADCCGCSVYGDIAREALGIERPAPPPKAPPLPFSTLGRQW